MRRALATVVILAILGGGGYAAFRWYADAQERQREAARQDAGETAAAYLAAWEAGDLDRMRRLLASSPATFDELHRSLVGEVGVTGIATQAGEPSLVDPADVAQGARVPFSTDLEIGQHGTWSYEGSIALDRDVAGERWLVDWSPATLHPLLEPGLRLDRALSWPDRAPVLDLDGRPLTATGTQLDRIVGTVGDITEERLAELGEPYEAGHDVGVSGLQRAYERRLSGLPAATIRIVTTDGAEVRTLADFPGQPPQPVPTGLDPDLQRAAEAALPAGTGNAALVVLDVGTAEIRAVVNRPTGGFDRAVLGRYPPGSTFKVVTTVALLRDGVAPDTTVPCPAETTVHGRRFRNFQGEAFGDIPFAEAFFRSCNTAFVQLAAELSSGALGEAAATLGFNSGYTLPIGTPVATFPEPADLAERAAAAIGQARVEASPLHMASVAAGIANGAWSAPVLVRDDPPSIAEGDVSGVSPTIRDLMLEVPRVGTAAGTGLPDGVAGKTGTAEYGTGDPLPTHAWFIGFHELDDGRRIAWAVLVEGGASGGSVAAPIARALLANLGAG